MSPVTPTPLPQKKENSSPPSRIDELLRLCEETFLCGNLKSALSYATSIALGNPNIPEVFAHLVAYRVHVAAATNRTIAGETDWYKVLGIDYCSSNATDQIFSRFFEVMGMLNGEKRKFAAAPGAYALIENAIAVLGTEDSRKAFDSRSGYGNISSEQRCLGEYRVDCHENSCSVTQETQRHETHKEE